MTYYQAYKNTMMCIYQYGVTECSPFRYSCHCYTNGTRKTPPASTNTIGRPVSRLRRLMVLLKKRDKAAKQKRKQTAHKSVKSVVHKVMPPRSLKSVVVKK